MRAYTKVAIPLVVFLIACIISLPSFFDTYRIMAFNTIPRDDYAPFVLRLATGQGSWPGSPFGYRVLSILPAVPLYRVLPLIRFSLLPNIAASYLRAVQALAFLSFLSIAAASTVAFEMVRNRLQGSIIQAAFVAALTLILSAFTGRIVVDPIAVFVIFLLLYFLGKPTTYCLAIMLTPFVNEKIPMFFLFLTLSRSVFVAGFLPMHRWQVAATIVATGVYIATVMTVRLPGNEWQTSATHAIPQLVTMVVTSVTSLKAIELDILPALVITIPCIAFSLFSRGSTKFLAWSDFLVPVGLFMLALAETTGVNVGRIVALALPLTVLSSGILIAQYDNRHNQSGGVETRIMQQTNE